MYPFLILLSVKTALLLIDVKKLRIVRKKTFVLESILGTGIIVTGLMLLHARTWVVPVWLWLKFILIFIAIIFAIFGLKKEKKPLPVISLALFLFIFLYALEKGFSW
jgi:hypothetical protein